jgi:transcriptional regulator with XRE-family HTH domain
MRAARALLGWSAQQLADASKVGVATIRRVEPVDGPVSMIASTSGAVQRALEAAGVEFIAENGGGAGVRMREPGK